MVKSAKNRRRSKRRVRLIFRKRRLVVGKKSSILWNKLHQVRLVKLFEKDKIELKKSLKIKESDQFRQKELSAASSSESSSRELFSFIPQLQSTIIESKIPAQESITFDSNFFPSADPNSQNQPFAMEKLKSPEILMDMYDPHPGLLAPSELPFYGNNFQTPTLETEPSVQTNQGLLGNPLLNVDCSKKLSCARDSGYQDTNGSTYISSSPVESRKVREVLHEVESYNQLKEAELCGEIHEAQKQVFLNIQV